MRQGLSPLISQEFRQLVSAMQASASYATICKRRSVGGTLADPDIHSTEEVERDPNAAFLKLQQATTNVGPAQEMDRAKFVNWLYGLRMDDLESLILNLALQATG